MSDPVRDTLLMRVRFTASDPDSELKLYLFVEPHIGDRGAANAAWVGQYKDVTMLLAQRDRTSMAVVSKPSMLQASCGYTGESDGLSLLAKHDELPDTNLAEQGNVALTGEIDWRSGNGTFTVSLPAGQILPRPHSRRERAYWKTLTRPPHFSSGTGRNNRHNTQRSKTSPGTSSYVSSEHGGA